jgi:hypothetical protein
MRQPDAIYNSRTIREIVASDTAGILRIKLGDEGVRIELEKG